jgi:DNA-binding NarL/FixJ family response regulator
MSKDTTLDEPSINNSSLGRVWRRQAIPTISTTQFSIAKEQASTARRAADGVMQPRPLDNSELDVLSLYANGSSTDEICEALRVHKGVVQDRLRVAVRKLGAVNRVHAAVIGAVSGIIRIRAVAGPHVRWPLHQALTQRR